MNTFDELVARVDDIGDTVKALRAEAATLPAIPLGVLRSLDDAHALLVYAGNTLAGDPTRARRG